LEYIDECAHFLRLPEITTSTYNKSSNEEGNEGKNIDIGRNNSLLSFLKDKRVHSTFLYSKTAMGGSTEMNSF
jgi:hypothetical protein